MKKFFLAVFILVDLLVIVGAGLFLAGHLKGTQPAILSSLPFIKTSPSTSPSVPVSTTSSTITATTDTLRNPNMPAPTVAGTPGVANSRKILFAYRNSRAKKVMVRADFTGWRAEAMEKDASGTWRYVAVLEPGEYAYCFSVDNKSIRDPANKHTKTVGKTIVSSIVVPAQSPTPH